METESYKLCIIKSAEVEYVDSETDYWIVDHYKPYIDHLDGRTYDPNIDMVEREVITPIRLRYPDGKEVFIGYSKIKCPEEVGTIFEVLKNNNGETEDLRNLYHSLKIKFEDLQRQLENSNSQTYKYQREVEKIKNLSFWGRIKFAFKPKL